MNSMLDEQRWFETVLGLCGTDVELGLHEGAVSGQGNTSGSVLTGKVVNTMFDSFLLQLRNGQQVIRFADVAYLLPIRAGSSAPVARAGSEPPRGNGQRR